MDRTLKVYAKTGHLFAEFTFNYDHRNQAEARYTTYHRLYTDEEPDEDKSVYAGMESDAYIQFRQFNSIDEIKAYDRDLVKKELGRDMKYPPDTYRYEYPEEPVLLRYVVATNKNVTGMVNILFSFINNTKEVKFLSATAPRFDVDISADSLETNINIITRIPVYTDRDTWEISSYDVKRLPAWY